MSNNKNRVTTNLRNDFSAYQNSDLQAWASPTDSAGQMCGSNKNVSNKEYLFFFDITECTSPMIFVHGCQTPQV